MIQYPKGARRPTVINKSSVQETNYSRRGMRFETMINDSNTFYLSRNQAVIHKKPTPIRIAHVDYPKRSAAKITEAYFTEASTTDYNGVFKGRYIDFEAKETKNKTSFPLKNFHQHQITHMELCQKQGGVCFALLWFSHWRRAFILPFDVLNEYWVNQEMARKSIPLSVIEEKGYECPLGIQPPIDYLKALSCFLHDQ